MFHIISIDRKLVTNGTLARFLRINFVYTYPDADQNNMFFFLVTSIKNLTLLEF